MSVNYELLPEHMREGARLYVEQGIEPGDFMLAVLCDSLTEAFARADWKNEMAMKQWAQWLVSECPLGIWGSTEAVDKWIEIGGMDGWREQKAETRE